MAPNESAAFRGGLVASWRIVRYATRIDRHILHPYDAIKATAVWHYDKGEYHVKPV